MTSRHRQRCNVEEECDRDQSRALYSAAVQATQHTADWVYAKFRLDISRALITNEHAVPISLHELKRNLHWLRKQALSIK
jgi:hypothetical protein